MAQAKFNSEPHLGRVIVLDTETTGLSPNYGDRMVELGAVEMIDGQLTGNTFHSYINPGIPVPQEASDVHGLTDRFLRDKPYFHQVYRGFLDFVGDVNTPAWAHNAPFDKRFLNFELEEVAGVELANFECSLKLARAVLGKGDRKLETLAKMAGISFGGRGAHSAMADAEVLAKVMSTMLWPKEAEIAGNPSLMPAKASNPAKKAKAAKDNTPAVVLPAGFVPLTAESDDRICRYDEHQIDHLITSRGKRWSAAEELKLVDAFLKEQRGLLELIAEHGRTPAALFMKLEALGVVAEGHPYARPR